MCPSSWRATVSMSKAFGTAPTLHACSESSKCSGFGRVLVMIPQAGREVGVGEDAADHRVIGIRGRAPVDGDVRRLGGARPR